MDILADVAEGEMSHELVITSLCAHRQRPDVTASIDLRRQKLSATERKIPEIS